MLLQSPVFDFYAVPVTFTPLRSQPGQPAYQGRGIFNTGPVDVPLEDGSVFSDQQTILDVRDSEFGTVPMQGDRITIPLDCNGAPLGDFEVVDADKNGGGQTTLTLRKYDVAKP